MPERYELKSAAPSWINGHVDASHNRVIAYVHGSTLYNVLSHAKFNAAHGVNIVVIDPDPAGVDRIANNRALNLNKNLIYNKTTTQWSKMFTYPSDRFMLDGAVINCGDEFGIIDAITLWPHIKPHGKMALIVPRCMYCMRDEKDTSGVPYQYRDELTTMAEDFYWGYNALSYILPETWYEKTAIRGEPEMWLFTKQESYNQYDDKERAAGKGRVKLEVVE